MTVLLAVCLLMMGAFIGFILAALINMAARDADEDRRKRWWDDDRRE